MAKFATNASGAMLLLNLIQVTESISGSVVPLAMFASIYKVSSLETLNKTVGTLMVTEETPDFQLSNGGLH